MKLKLNGILTLLLVLMAQLTHAQDITASGTVTDPSGLPIPGVNVIVKGTTGGTQTDFDGKFKISAKQGDKLVFTFLGMKTQELTAAANMAVKMTDNSVQLEGVVVTSQGIKKEKKKLGYAVSEIKASQIEERPDSDVARILSGKASGVNIISQNGLSGSGTNVIIRGYKSFSSTNQALFIVDGVPFSSDTNSVGRQGERNDFVNGNNGSSRFLDLDPNNIESVNVLKGLAASTLYGSAGRNGVILITTKAGSNKKGSKKGNITLTSSLFFNDIASLPDYQNVYGNGFDQAFGWFFSNWGPKFEKGGTAGWGNSSAFDANGTLPHPYSTASFSGVFPEYQGVRYQWKPYNSVKDFFKTGIVSTNSINFKGQSDDGDLLYSLNYGHTEDQGFTPGNKVVRNNLSVGGSAKVSKKITVNGTLNYAKTDFVSPPVALSQGNGATGTGSSIFGDLWFTPRSIDIQGLPYQNPLTGGSVYYRQDNSIQHPLWTLNNSGTEQNTNRFFGNASISYEINSHFNLLYRVGLDNYNEANLNYQNKGGVNTNSGNARTASGFYETWNNTNTIWDHNLMLNGKYALTEKLNLNFNLGATTRNETFEQNGVASDGQQIFGVLRHYNFANSLPIENFADRNIVGVYSQVDLDYNSYLFLNLSARKDWVSNFASKNNSKMYPSASLSFLPTTAFESLSSEKGLNFLKFRFGIGTSANFGDFGSYPATNTLLLNVRDSQSGTQNVVTNSVGATLGNPDLKPELLTEYEFGIETKFYKNRFGIDLSLYQRVTKDLIINRPLDASTFYTQTLTNIGEIKGHGIELDLSATIIKPALDNGFKWEANVNFTQSDTEVTDLGQDTDRIVYSGFSNLGNVAEVGAPLTSIFGSRVLRDANGNLVVGADGNYIQDPNDGIIGDANPDWVMNVNNTFSYKNFDFSFLVNYTKGGDVYSNTISTLLGRGLIEETVDRERTFILPGVNEAGQTNNVQINNSDYYFTNFAFGPSELQVYDATTIRLQEVSLGYNFPAKLLEKTAFSAVSFKVSGTNLYYRAINTPKGANFDPNTSGTGVGNGIGFDFLNGPSSKRYGFSLKISF
ncbi:SusC/RagA family TonB-linked outer membrane protein [Flavobacterium sp. CYK-4]|uniref:SusC/RagA family TonB-linked outer membrane protein n=1 Tax=Flavobacterium lotistagni TaxID=2709660 RepID=UPI0014075C6F|nr:SusC/RagA family TonB-linked outer membrane protein [Flavobacterium lotistagni]NHM06521.1 SusC/RagA family TonB-linked outer membrane protein [Flavobacterium lotistagni]